MSEENDGYIMEVNGSEVYVENGEVSYEVTEPDYHDELTEPDYHEQEDTNDFLEEFLELSAKLEG